MIRYSYKASLKNIFFAVNFFALATVFIFVTFGIEGLWMKIGLSFMFLLTFGAGILFLRFYIKNRKSKSIILTEEKLILPIKTSNKTRQIKYENIKDIYVSKVQNDMFSTLERNILIVTKSTTYTIEKSWMKNKQEFYSLLENLQKRANIEKNSSTQ